MPDPIKHAEYVDLMRNLAKALGVLAKVDLAPLKAHNDKVLSLGRLNPIAWEKHADTVRSEMRLLESADAAQRCLSGEPL